MDDLGEVQPISGNPHMIYDVLVMDMDSDFQRKKCLDNVILTDPFFGSWL